MIHRMYSHLLFCVIVTFIVGCSITQPQTQETQEFEKVAYSVQVGSFIKADNAWKFVDKLNSYGLDAFLFKSKRTYKVRFGDYATKQEAIKKAKEFQKRGFFEEFFIVAPQDLAINRRTKKNPNQIREDISESTYGYIGVPYKWGGVTESGFDCSGLTHTVYRLNGISIPRTSIEQYKAGKSVAKKNLKKGDLVFFATKRRRINHVGIYVGNDKFIHAPSRGKTVREANLNSKYWTRVYRGSRQFL
ncbi:hydrolase [Helicobacter monodelphidis]|uniref:NlpC/P60 family protein n=1 Tax=Helicobacter sp. 15-1451 TaxID=2004995 RepID=UPI000DCCD307|nr:NlpC/P60 family protein [Helicobacter sp. 15-1451]RAX57140.1 hydrolase [Helicobacter sp. 15-1451]